MDQGNYSQSHAGTYQVDTPNGFGETNPNCACGQRMKLVESKSAANPNRWFYACPRPKAQQCKGEGSFYWVDEYCAPQQAHLVGNSFVPEPFGGAKPRVIPMQPGGQITNAVHLQRILDFMERGVSLLQSIEEQQIIITNHIVEQRHTADDQKIEEHNKKIQEEAHETKRPRMYKSFSQAMEEEPKKAKRDIY